MEINRHLRRRYRVTKFVCHVTSKNQLADVLKKGLPKLQELISKLNIMNIYGALKIKNLVLSSGPTT